MNQHHKVKKLIEKIEILAKRLDHEKSLLVHNKLDQFFYLQKAEELKILLGQFEEVEKRILTLKNNLECNYVIVYHQWRRDIRWINSRNRTDFTVF